MSYNNAPASHSPSLPLPDFDAPGFARWIRPPAGSEHCPHSGLRRTALNSFLKRSRGSIRTLRVGEAGAKRGCRLIWLSDLMRALHAEATKETRREAASLRLGDEQIAALPRALS